MEEVDRNGVVVVRVFMAVVSFSVSVVLAVTLAPGAMASGAPSAVGTAPTAVEEVPREVPTPVSPVPVDVPGVVPGGDFSVSPPMADAAGAELAAAGMAPEEAARVATEVDGFDRARSTVVDRSEFEETYENPDGTATTAMSVEPMNVQAVDGSWARVDNTVTATLDGGAQAPGSALRPTFANRADKQGLLTVKRKGVSVDFSLVGAAPVRAVRSDSGVSYPGVFPGVDLRYEVRDSGVKEFLTVADSASVGSGE